MAKVFITGSSDGLGLLTAKSLIAQGHQVVVHARNETRRQETLDKILGAENILVADLSIIEETKQLASQVNSLGKFDAVIHNAGVYSPSSKDIFSVNVLAPYILTCLIEKSERLIYVSSDMHHYGNSNLNDHKININRITYSDSKLYVLMLCKAVARKWPHVFANAVHPGWVPTKMGGNGAPDDLQKGYETQVWLAVSSEEKAKVNGRYFFHQQEKRCNPQADDIELQERFLSFCKEVTGISLP